MATIIVQSPPCPFCGRVSDVAVGEDAYKLWRQLGVPLQVAMSELSADERELLLTGTCHDDWELYMKADPDGESFLPHDVEPGVEIGYDELIAEIDLTNRPLSIAEIAAADPWRQGFGSADAAFDTPEEMSAFDKLVDRCLECGRVAGTLHRMDCSRGRD